MRGLCGLSGGDGQTGRAGARDLRVNERTMGNWCAKDRGGLEGTDGLPSDDAAELKRLRSENVELRMERDVLSAPWSCG